MDEFGSSISEPSRYLHDGDTASAESILEVALGIDLEDAELGSDWVLEPSQEMLDRSERLVGSHPSPAVVTLLVEGWRESYHRKRVHELIVELTRQAAERWWAGDHSKELEWAINRLSHAFRYGVRSTDLGLLAELCTDPRFTYEGDVVDLRCYWFESLGKIRDPRVGEICRTIIDGDLGQWHDLRIAFAVQALHRVWDDTDFERVERVANEHPDSHVRRVAKRRLEQHS